MNSTQSRAARRALDRRLSHLPPAAAFTPPARGWIRAVRNALGMSAADLAARLQVVSPPPVVAQPPTKPCVMTEGGRPKEALARAPEQRSQRRSNHLGPCDRPAHRHGEAAARAARR